MYPPMYANVFLLDTSAYIKMRLCNFMFFDTFLTRYIGIHRWIHRDTSGYIDTRGSECSMWKGFNRPITLRCDRCMPMYPMKRCIPMYPIPMYANVSPNMHFDVCRCIQLCLILKLWKLETSMSMYANVSQNMQFDVCRCIQLCLILKLWKLET